MAILLDLTINRLSRRVVAFLGNQADASWNSNSTLLSVYYVVNVFFNLKKFFTAEFRQWSTHAGESKNGRDG
jgi:hypothetical protein